MSSVEHVVVNTAKGILRGKKVLSVRRGSYFSFQGIPYAKPPVGNLRFKAPVEVEPWTGIKDALKEGPTAPSHNLITREFLEDSSEDCLYLNVYTTKVEPDSEPLRAVLFWIHGGGFNSGSGSTDFYSPDYLVTENIVLVTCNYRLGPLGFLSLQNAECPGNFGLKDMVQALRWCQQNISFFGGDPKNVTIFGESAGGAAVHYLTLTEKTKGLFHKAIIQSGVATNPWAISSKPRESAFKLGEALGCKTNDEKVLLNFLKEVSTKDFVNKSKGILKAVEPTEYYIENAFVPCVEPNCEEALITQHPDDIYKSGKIRKIPILIGANTLEGLIVLKRGEKIPELNTDKELARLIPRNLRIPPESELAREIIQKIRSFYFPKGFNEENCVQALSRIYFYNGINQTIDYLSNFSDASAPTYVYLFAFNGNVFAFKHFLGFQDWKGTCHADELIYLFRQTMFNFTLTPASKEYATMETLTKLWTDFAKTGTPLPQNPNSWPAIQKNRFPYTEIDETLIQKSDFQRKEFEFWLDILKLASKTQPTAKL